MAGEARCRVEPAVDLVLVQIVSPMRHDALWGVLELVARLQLFLVRVAICAEALVMAGPAGVLLLDGDEFMPHPEVGGMVQ